MAEVKPKMIVTMKLEGTCPSHARTDVRVGSNEITIDEPVARGGTDLGPSPTETLVAALVACTNVIGHRVAESHGVHFQAMSVDAEAQFDRHGVSLTAEVDVPFPQILLKITVTTEAGEDAMQKVKDDLAKFCPLAKVLRQSGTVIDEQWTVNRP